MWSRLAFSVLSSSGLPLICFVAQANPEVSFFFFRRFFYALAYLIILVWLLA